MKDIMRSPLFIPGTRKISSVQQVMQENRQTIAIIIDEYSGTDGLITQSDIHREIFGTAGNQSPLMGESNVFEFANKTEFTIDGVTALIDLKNIIGVQLFSDFNDSVGGWIMERLDRIPVAGDKVVYEGWIFTVQKVERRRIIEIKIQKDNGEVGE